MIPWFGLAEMPIHCLHASWRVRRLGNGPVSARSFWGCFLAAAPGQGAGGRDRSHQVPGNPTPVFQHPPDRPRSWRAGTPRPNPANAGRKSIGFPGAFGTDLMVPPNRRWALDRSDLSALGSMSKSGVQLSLTSRRGTQHVREVRRGAEPIRRRGCAQCAPVTPSPGSGLRSDAATWFRRSD